MILLKGSRGIKLEKIINNILIMSPVIFVVFFVAIIFFGGITIGYKLINGIWKNKEKKKNDEIKNNKKVKIMFGNQNMRT